MPVYVYRCESCGVQFERYQSFKDNPLTRCPECSQKSLRKVYQPVGIVFKGSGFYATDHKSPSGANPTVKDKNEKTEKKSGEGEGQKPSPDEKTETTPKAPAKTPTSEEK
jgi:putative FmdB family regulatory protein